MSKKTHRNYSVDWPAWIAGQPGCHLTQKVVVLRRQCKLQAKSEKVVTAKCVNNS